MTAIQFVGRPPTKFRLRGPMISAAIIIAIIAIWELLAVTVFSGRFVVPAPYSVLRQAHRDDYYLSDLRTTLGIAWKGYLLGNLAALVLAAICLVAPVTEGALTTLGVATYCVPTIAVGPLLVVLYGGGGAKMVMSALSVFFITLVAAITGLRAASPTSLEVITVFGGSRWQQLARVRVRASIPILASGLCVAAPAAILGAMIGDYLGGDRGLGVVMLQAQQQLNVPRTWAIALVSTAACAIAFGLTAVLARRAGAHVDAALDSGLTRRSVRRPVPATIALTALRIVGAVVFGLLVWEVLIKTTGLSSYFVKSPRDVWRYLFDGPKAIARRHVIDENLTRTLQDAGRGWLAGTIVAVIVASVLVMVPRVGTAVMPFVIVLRSVPLIAMCPLLGLVFGRGVVGVTIIAGVVTFVPSLVTIVGGLRTAPSSATDVIHCFGGARFAALIDVRIPFSTPSLFAAAKVSMPGAVLGSVLAEWLITGHGLGHSMAYDIITSNYAELWTSIALLLVVSLALYMVVGFAENGVRRKISGS